MEAGDYGYASGDGRAELDVLIQAARHADQFRTAMRDELFIGGDHGLAGCQGPAHPILGGEYTAHYLDDDVDVGGENVVDVLCPDDFRGNPVNFFARHVAIADVCQPQRNAGALDENLSDGPADRSEPGQRHLPDFVAWRSGVRSWRAGRV